MSLKFHRMRYWADVIDCSESPRICLTLCLVYTKPTVSKATDRWFWAKPQQVLCTFLRPSVIDVQRTAISSIMSKCAWVISLLLHVPMFHPFPCLVGRRFNDFLLVVSCIAFSSSLLDAICYEWREVNWYARSLNPATSGLVQNACMLCQVDGVVYQWMSIPTSTFHCIAKSVMPSSAVHP